MVIKWRDFNEMPLVCDNDRLSSPLVIRHATRPHDFEGSYRYQYGYDRLVFNTGADAEELKMFTTQMDDLEWAYLRSSDETLHKCN